MATNNELASLPVPPPGWKPTPSTIDGLPVDSQGLPIPPKGWTLMGGPGDHIDSPAVGGDTLYGLPIPGWVDRPLAGAGEAVVNMGRGLGERLGLESRSAIEQSRQLDAPLDATTGGAVGNVLGNLAVGAMVPGGALEGVAGGAVLGGAFGAAQPSLSAKNTWKHIADQAVLGGAGGALAGWLGRGSGADEAALHADRDAVLQAAQKEGLRVPPTSVKGTVAPTVIESVSGKAPTRQAMRDINQRVFNRLSREDLGLPSTTPITKDILKTVRQKAGQVYEQVRGVGAVPSDAAYAHDLQEVLSGAPGLETAYPGIGGGVDDKLGKLVTAVSQPVHDSGKLLDAVRSLRNEAKGNFRMSSISGDPDALSLARGQQGVADAMENLMGRHLQANGQGALADQWGQARATIAKTHNLEAALHGNDIVGADLARQARKGVPFTGKLGLISRFANHFPDVSTRGVGGAGVSKLAVAAAEAGGLGSIALHSPDMALGSLAFTAAPYGARKFLTSGLGQRILVTPQYGPGVFARGLGAVAARAGAVPLNQLFNGASP